MTKWRKGAKTYFMASEKHPHSHAHGHSHSHSHAGADLSQRMGAAFLLNFGFAIIELVGGFYTNSMAVTSDALHDFGDALALAMAWWFEKKSLQKSDALFTYGYRRFSLISAFATGCILVMGALWVLTASIPRLWHPEPVKTGGMFFLALLGITINGLAFFRLSKGSSLNEKIIRWHFIEDLLGWVFVLFGSAVMFFVEAPWIDPLMAILLSGWVLWNVAKHLKSTISVFMQATPGHLRQGEAEEWMGTQGGVKNVHHTHIWSLDGESHILTTHVVLRPGVSPEKMHDLKKDLKRGLREKFDIFEATIEFETSEENCVDPEH